MSGVQVSPTSHPSSRASAFAGFGASLVIDGAGRILRCSPWVTAALGWPPGALAGLPVSAVIADLPFAAGTPGYNLAYAVFHGAEGAWSRRTALTAQGMKVPVDIALAKVSVDGKPCIAFSLRQPLHASPPRASRLPSDAGLSVQAASVPAR